MLGMRVWCLTSTRSHSRLLPNAPLLFLSGFDGLATRLCPECARGAAATATAAAPAPAATGPLRLGAWAQSHGGNGCLYCFGFDYHGLWLTIAGGLVLTLLA